MTLSASGVNSILGGAVFNWQGFVHPGQDVRKDGVGKMLMEAIGKSAKEPHRIVRDFLSSSLSTAMGLKVGDGEKEGGLSVLEFVNFPEDGSPDWCSWSGVAYPLPWNLIQSQSGASFWQVAQAVSEPSLHEFFVGYRPGADGVLVPSLVHRPRPFPGLERWDKFWHALPIVQVGGATGLSVLGVDEVLSMDGRHNTFHWAGLGLGDHSKEAFFAKLFWGWASSFDLVNRYGYSSTGVVSKLAPIMPGADIKDYLTFAKDHLLHYAFQEAPIPLLTTRSVECVFLPVRPGQVLEDHSAGSDSDSVVTGYVTGTDFSLRGTGDSFSLSMGATVERCLRGTDAPHYPAKVRALLPDLMLHNYAGEGVAEPGPEPAVDSEFKPPQQLASPPGAIPAEIHSAIVKAAARESIPAWLIAHVLHNETGIGRFWGDDPEAAKAKGIGQITAPALADLMASGYTNPDGSAFLGSDRRNAVNCVYATARYLKICQGAIEANPGGFPKASGESYYSWVCRAYRYGPADARAKGSDWGWRWPAAGEAFPDYTRYWSPAGVTAGQRIWGYLG